MKAITLRNLPPDLAERIEAEAERTSASLNATVIRLLKQALIAPGSGSDGKRIKKRDLSDLGGRWTAEEADEFDAFLAEHRRIDPDDWR